MRPEGTKVEQVTDTVLYVGTEVKRKSTADVENRMQMHTINRKVYFFRSVFFQMCSKLQEGSTLKKCKQARPPRVLASQTTAVQNQPHTSCNTNMLQQETRRFIYVFRLIDNANFSLFDETMSAILVHLDFGPFT